MFTKLLIANRGEIACRIIRTAERLGIATVAVYSDADAGGLHVELADEAHRLGPASAGESYLDVERVLEIARSSRAQALHPGYGFLAENPKLVEACDAAGIAFVGPPADVVRAMGSKAEAKRRAQDAGIPVVPGYFGDDQSDRRLAKEAGAVGYPVLVKAVLGGGGRGMRVVESKNALFDALEGARRESMSTFGDDRLLIERYLEHPRHIEVQVFADTQGRCVHLFERDCSAQRRHQKIVEEAPAPSLNDALRRALSDAAVKLATAIGYVGAGTVEFLVQDDEFFFMEMNTRLQVEHPVTELITDTDLVEWQLVVAAGEPLPRAQDEILSSGHAVEVRLYCEDTENGFLPATGRLEALAFPRGRHGIRVDSGVRPGDEVTPYYDAMIAKVIAHGDDRSGAFERLEAALAHTVIGGVTTNLGFLALLLKQSELVGGTVDTRFVASWDGGRALAFQPQWKWDALAALALLTHRRERARATGPWGTLDSFRMNLVPLERVSLSRNGQRMEFSVLDRSDGFELRGEERSVVATVRRRGAMLTGVMDDEAFVVHSEFRDHEVELVWGGWRRSYAEEVDRSALNELEAAAGTLASPMPGQVVKVFVKTGDRVKLGSALLVVEAMKIEHTIRAPADGRVDEVLYSVGDKVDEGVELVRLALDD